MSAAPAARYTLTADQLRQLETAWGGRLPDTFHTDWSDDVPADERQRRDAQARDELHAAGLLVPTPHDQDDPTGVEVEPHVRRFLDVLHRTRVVVAVHAWDEDHQQVEQVWCDGQWGLSLRRGRRPASPDLPGPPPQASAARDDAPWADRNAIHLTLAQPGTVLARPLDLFEQVRGPHERTVTAAPVVLSVARSVAVVRACQPGHRREVAYEMLRRVGADPSGEPFHSLALGIDAGFEITVTSPASPVGQHGTYLRAQDMWVSLAAQVGSVVPQVNAGGRLSGPALAEASTVRLAPTTTSSIVADYLAAVTAVTRGRPAPRGAASE